MFVRMPRTLRSQLSVTVRVGNSGSNYLQPSGDFSSVLASHNGRPVSKIITDVASVADLLFKLLSSGKERNPGERWVSRKKIKKVLRPILIMRIELMATVTIIGPSHRSIKNMLRTILRIFDTVKLICDSQM